MTRVAKRAFALAGTCCVLAAGAARADYIISADLQPGVEQADPSYGPTPDVLFQLIITDAAVEQRLFRFTANSDLSYGPGGTNPIHTLDTSGDTANFVSFKAGYGSLNSPEFDTTGTFPYPGNIFIQLFFDPAGNLFASSVGYGDASGTVGIFIDSDDDSDSDRNYAVASVTNDNPVFNCIVVGMACFDLGQVTITQTSNSSVPEPTTFAVLGVGLLGMGALRRQFATHSTEEVQCPERHKRCCSQR